MDTSPQNIFSPHFSNEQDKSPLIPKWLRLFFQIYAVLAASFTFFHLLNLLLQPSSGGLLGSLGKVLQIEGAPMEYPLLIIILAAIQILYFIVLLLYYYGLFRMRRWSVAISVILGIDTLLTVLYRVVQVEGGGIGNSFTILASLVVVAVAVISVIQRRVFVGSSRKLLIQIPLLLFIFPSIMYLAGTIIFTDIKQVDDADVTPVEQPVLADEDNAYTSLIKKADMTEVEIEAIASAKEVYRTVRSLEEEVNLAELQRTVDETKRLTDAFMIAATKSGLQCPGIVNDFSPNTPLCELNTIRDTGVLMYLRVHNSLNNDDYEAATQESLAIIEFAHNAETISTSNLIIEYLVTTAVRLMGNEALRDTLGTLGEAVHMQIITESEANTLRAEARKVLLGTKPDVQTLVDMYRSEYGYHKAVFDSIADSNHLPPSYTWHPNRTKQSFADLAAFSVEYSVTYCGSVEEEQSLKKVESAVTKYSEDGLPLVVFKPNSIGRILTSVAAASMTSVKERYCEIEAEHQELLQWTE